MSAPDCVVLGAGGFIGSHIAEAMAHQGYIVRGYDREPWPGRTPSPVEFHQCDLLAPGVVEDTVESATVIIYCLSATTPATSAERPTTDIQENLIPLVRVAGAASRGTVERLVFLSSGGTVYGPSDRLPISETHSTHPVSPYGVVKLASEHYLHLFSHQSDLETVSLRLSNPYGPRQTTSGGLGVVSALLEATHDGRPFSLIGDGSVERDFIYIDDVVRAVLAAAQAESLSGVFNVGTGRGTTLRELIPLAEAATGKRLQIEHRPGRPFDVPRNVLDCSRARESFGWQPEVSLEDGLVLTWDWFQKMSTPGSS